jgi:hypothetical protein
LQITAFQRNLSILCLLAQSLLLRFTDAGIYIREDEVFMPNPKNAAKIFSIVSILFFAIPICGQTSDSIYTIPKGTRIRLKMDNEINSGVSGVGDTFTAVVVAPVMLGEIETLPAGKVIEGKIIRVKKAALGKSAGSFEVKFETLYLSEKIKLQIDASLVDTKKPESSQAANVVTIAGATGIGALVGTLVDKSKGTLAGAGIGLGIGAGAVLLQKGKEARIKAGEEFDILLNREVNLPPDDF